MLMKFIEEEWNELCPIFYEYEDKFKQIGTGVLIELEKKIYLLTAAHVVDEIYKNESSKLFLPSINGFDVIDGELFHNPLTWNQKREDDQVDFSYYKLSTHMVSLLNKNFKPLKEDKIEFSYDNTFDFDNSIKPIHHKEAIKKLKTIYNNVENYRDEINFIENFQIDETVTFAGYPHTKSTSKDSQYSSETVYYHGRRMEYSTYNNFKYDMSINIIAEYGKKGAMNRNFDLNNPPKPQGISGGGVYKIVKRDDRFDRKLIGIGHTYKSKQHLFIGTNIKHCIDLITNNKLMPYEVYQRLKRMTTIMHGMYINQ